MWFVMCFIFHLCSQLYILMSSNFDIDLKFGQIYEEKIKNIFAGKIEVKAERDKWKKTGNIAIEIRYKGRPSGLSITEADWWIQLLTYEGKIEIGFMFKVSRLKQMVKNKIKKDKVCIMFGGDNNKSELVLIPIKEITEDII